MILYHFFRIKLAEYSRDVKPVTYCYFDTFEIANVKI